MTWLFLSNVREKDIEDKAALATLYPSVAGHSYSEWETKECDDEEKENAVSAKSEEPGYGQRRVNNFLRSGYLFCFHYVK